MTRSEATFHRLEPVERLIHRNGRLAEEHGLFHDHELMQDGIYTITDARQAVADYYVGSDADEVFDLEVLPLCLCLPECLCATGSCDCAEA